MIEYLLQPGFDFEGVGGCGKKLITGGELPAAGMDHLD